MSSRRRFVQIGTGACLALALPGCGKTPIVTGEQRGRTITVSLAEVLDHLKHRPGVWVQSARLSFPIIVTRDGGSWYAVSGRCTHESCRVRPTKTLLACTCHGSRFTRTGEMRGGPAPRPLPRYDIQEQGDELLIEL